MSSTQSTKVPVTRVPQPHHTDFGHCLTSAQLCDALAEPSRFTAVAGGAMHSLNADGQEQQEPYLSSRSNFGQILHASRVRLG